MGQSIFISKDDTFKVTVYYKFSDNKIQILEAKEEGAQSLEVTFRRPDYGVTQNVLRASTTLQDGQPVLNFLQLQTSLLYALISAWDAKDDKGKAIPVNNATISSLAPEVAKRLIDLLFSELGPTGVI